MNLKLERPAMRGLVLTALLVAPPAFAADCQHDLISRITHDHNAAMPYVIVTSSGRHLRIYGQDLINPHDWRAGDSVSVCVDPRGPNGYLVKDLRLHQTLATLTEQ